MESTDASGIFSRSTSPQQPKNPLTPSRTIVSSTKYYAEMESTDDVPPPLGTLKTPSSDETYVPRFQCRRATNLIKTPDTPTPSPRLEHSRYMLTNDGDVRLPLDRRTLTSLARPRTPTPPSPPPPSPSNISSRDGTYPPRFLGPEATALAKRLNSPSLSVSKESAIEPGWSEDVDGWLFPNELMEPKNNTTASTSSPQRVFHRRNNKTVEQADVLEFDPFYSNPSTSATYQHQGSSADMLKPVGDFTILNQVTEVPRSRSPSYYSDHMDEDVTFDLGQLHEAALPVKQAEGDGDEMLLDVSGNEMPAETYDYDMDNQNYLEERAIETQEYRNLHHHSPTLAILEGRAPYQVEDDEFYGMDIVTFMNRLRQGKRFDEAPIETRNDEMPVEARNDKMQCWNEMHEMPIQSPSSEIQHSTAADEMLIDTPNEKMPMETQVVSWSLPEDVKDVWDHSILLYQAGFIQQALDSYKALMKGEDLPIPVQVLLHVNIGIILYTLGEFDTCCQALDYVVHKLNPSANIMALCFFHMGSASFNMRQLETAEGYWGASLAELMENSIRLENPEEAVEDEALDPIFFEFHDLGMSFTLTSCTLRHNLKVVAERLTVEKRTPMRSLVRWQVRTLAPDMIFVAPLTLPNCVSLLAQSSQETTPSWRKPAYISPSSSSSPYTISAGGHAFACSPRRLETIQERNTPPPESHTPSGRAWRTPSRQVPETPESSKGEGGFLKRKKSGWFSFSKKKSR